MTVLVPEPDEGPAFFALGGERTLALSLLHHLADLRGYCLRQA